MNIRVCLRGVKRTNFCISYHMNLYLTANNSIQYLNLSTSPWLGSSYELNNNIWIQAVSEYLKEEEKKLQTVQKISCHVL